MTTPTGRSPYSRRAKRSAWKSTLRDRLWYEQGGACALCGNFIPRMHITFEHLVPKTKGGPVSYGNGLATCLTCNVAKADSMEEAYKSYPILMEA